MAPPQRNAADCQGAERGLGMRQVAHKGAHRGIASEPTGKNRCVPLLPLSAQSRKHYMPPRSAAADGSARETAGKPADLLQLILAFHLPDRDLAVVAPSRAGATVGR